MKATIIATAMALLALGATAREVEIRHAAEIEFEAERGHYYQLQRSTNTTDWVNVEDRIFGHGGKERRLKSTQSNDGATHEFFRVIVTDAPTNGFAPWTFAGLSVNLDNRPGGDVMKFLTETNGVDQGTVPDPFVYSFTRSGTNEVRIETHPPTYYFDRRNVYVFTFTGAGMGTWVRDEYRRGQLKDRDVGVFSYVTDAGNPGGGTSNPPAVVPTEVLTTPAGFAFTFQSGETPERLEFTSALSGTEFGDDTGDTEANVFNYTYSLTSSNAASIVATFKPGKYDEYSLTYTSPSKGTFVRREFKDGVLSDTDTGAFSVVALPAGSVSHPPVGTMPKTTLSGLTYTMNDGGAVVTKLVISSATAGTEFDDSAPTQFTYTYTVTGALAAKLVLRFKTDKWDEYDLTFADASNSGTFVRREFDKNALKDTDSGVFTGVTTTP